MAKRSGRIQRFLRWLLGSPFHDLSDAFGDPVPPEQRVFEAQVDEMQHQPHGKAAVAMSSSHRTKPM